MHPHHEQHPTTLKPTTPEPTTPDHTAPDHTAPDHTAPDHTVTGLTATDPCRPGTVTESSSEPALPAPHLPGDGCTECADPPGTWRGDLIGALVITAVCALIMLVFARAAWGVAAPPLPDDLGTLNAVIDRARNVLVGISAALATFFLAYGGIRKMTAGGDPGEVEAGNRSMKFAGYGYAICILAPVLFAVLKYVVGQS